MTTISQRLSFPNQALLFDLEQLYRCFQTVPDRRKRRRWRYPLAALLMMGVLAKADCPDAWRLCLDRQGNQPEMYEQLALLFQPQQSRVLAIYDIRRAN
jgi:hypothetical protein